MLVVMLVMVQSPKNPVVTVRAQRQSSERCQEEKEDVRRMQIAKTPYKN
jgi:hypothetical protein